MIAAWAGDGATRAISWGSVGLLAAAALSLAGAGGAWRRWVSPGCIMPMRSPLLPSC